MTPALLPIFATPFASVSLPQVRDLHPALVQLIAGRSTPANRDPLYHQDPLCYRSREELFEWPDAAAAVLRQQMLAGICRTVMAANLYSQAEFDALTLQARARFAIVKPNGAIAAADVPLTSWCGIYCIAAPAAVPERGDSAALRLYETRMANMFMDASTYRLRQPFSHGHYVWRPVPGEMAVFPGSILHEVALNRGDSELWLVLARARFTAPGMEGLPPW